AFAARRGPAAAATGAGSAAAWRRGQGAGTAVESRDGARCAESVSLVESAARYGAPGFVYSRAALESAFRRFDAAFGEFPHTVCYAVKANANLAVLNILARLGSGFDVVSGGELARVIAAGGNPATVVFSGV